MQKITDGKEMAKVLSDFANNFGCDEKGFVEGVLSEHRTLQQSMFRLFCDCIKAWSKEEYFDLRNEATVLLSKELNKILEERGYIPFI